MKTQLISLVTAGTITSAQETAIETALTAKDNNKDEKHENGIKTQLNALVTAGTITSGQETAIEAALTPSK
jgi:competence protein ComGC